jgi:hypothetical protein
MPIKCLMDSLEKGHSRPVSVWAKLGLWLRRIVCITGGAAIAAVLFFLHAITMKPLSSAMEERIRFKAAGCPLGGAIGASIGAVIVFRAERLERRNGI